MMRMNMPDNIALMLLNLTISVLKCDHHQKMSIDYIIYNKFTFN